MMKTTEERAENMVERAYDMSPLKHKASEYCENPFPMHSFERAATVFWHGFVSECFDRGLTEDQVEWLLRSKEMRRMFDDHSPELEDFARTFVTDSMLVTAIVETWED